MPAPRLHHLDFLRAAMMLLGIGVHATHADYDLGDYQWIRFASGSFRMACFFVIAGYFSHMSLERHGPRRFLVRRAAALGIPALFAVLLLNPSILAWMTEYFATAPVPATPNINWHGPMWFLFVLLAYSLATPAAVRLVRAGFDVAARRWGPGVAAGVVVVALAVGAAGAGKVLETLAPHLPGSGAFGWLTQATFSHVPYFALGLLMYRSGPVFALVHSRPWTWGALAACAVAARYVASQREVTALGEHLAHVAVDYASRFSCSIALMGAARIVLRRELRLVTFAAESAYTLYVVHYFVIAYALVQAERAGLPVAWRALSAAALAVATGLAVHVVLVRRLPLVALLLNGRLPAAPRAGALGVGSAARA